MASLETSVFLAQFWGALMVILSALFLIRKRVLLDEFLSQINDRMFTIFNGFFALVVGLVTVLVHNVWVQDWRLVVTLFGWASLVKGITLIGYPEFLKTSTNMMRKRPVLTQALLVVSLLLGAWLMWQVRGV